jgi:hypothetical protein
VRLRSRRLGQQSPEFFELAVIDADGPPTANARRGSVCRSYKGLWGYHVLLISLADTKEMLFLVNRSGNRPSYEHADVYLARAHLLSNSLQTTGGADDLGFKAIDTLLRYCRSPEDR